MTQDETAAPFAPYLSRLVRDWARDHPDDRTRVLDGTLLSVDVSGFTNLSERLALKGRAGAEELILVLSGCFEGLIGVAHLHGGDVLKFRGDALLILFSGDDHEQRAFEAASGMQWFIEHTAPSMSSVGPVELRMACGIWSGPCHFFLVEGPHLELVVAGPTATGAAELEDAAGPGEIMVGDQRGGARLLERVEPTAPPDAVVPEPTNVPGLERFVPPTLRAHLSVAGGEGEHRQATMAFVELSGTDALLEREGPEGLAHTLQLLGSAVERACSGFGVTWLESDIAPGSIKVYLTAGAPSTTGSDEEAMLRAVREILDASGDTSLRAGVNRGAIFAGDVGATTRRAYAVMGDPVNLAARLCGRAQPGQILATGEVLERSGARFDTEREPFLVKGKELSLMAYRVGSLSGLRQEDAAWSLPLVGRKHELESLAEAVGAARTMQSRVIELVGEPGIGKSRLVQELRSLSVGFNQLASACERYSQTEPFFAWRGILRQLAGITPGHSREEAGAHLEPWIGTVMPDLAPSLPLLAVPFDAEVSPTPESDSIEAEFRLRRLNDAVEQFLQRVLMMPTLLVFEDAHWMDDASRFLLGQLTENPAPRPWLVCITRRPEGESPVRQEGRATQLVLEPLSDRHAEQLVLAAAEELAMSEESLAALAGRSGGNPLFIRELVAASREGGSLDALPETIETLITTRIDRLEPADRMLLRSAAVVGESFELPLLEEVLADELPDAAELATWDRLSEFVVWEGAETIAFRHGLIRATAYAGLSYRRRRAIHGRVGDTLEAQLNGRGNELAALLSLHFLEAERYESAWRYAVAAGDRARAQSANVVAGELYERALAAGRHVELPAEEVARVAEALGDVSERAGRFEQAEAAYAEAATLVGDDREAESRLMMKRGVLSERAGAYDGALEWYERALGQAGSAGLRAELELAYAGVRHRQGRFAEAVDWAERAAAHAEEAGSVRELAHAYYLLDVAHTRLGTPDPSYNERALPMLEEAGDLVGQANVLNNLGVAAYFEGRWEEALEAYRRSGELSRRAGDVVSGARATNNEAEILSDQGHLDDAGERFEEALRVWRAAHYPVGAALATSNLGRVAARAGRFEDAHVLLERALDEFQAIGAESFVRETRARIAECLVFAGQHGEAARLAAETLAAGDGDPSVLEAALERTLGYAAVQARRSPDEARLHFTRSLDRARTLGADYEAGLTLKAISETDPDRMDARGESERILTALGVLTTPAIPLP
ncbi:MAG TPA: tetratricopeptide repeat protein [Gaiellaceae bacterium]